jgi:hypothetical protein
MIHLDPTPEVTTMARRAFPAYRGRKYKLDNSDHPVSTTSYWGCGSRDYFVALDLATNRILPIPQNGTPFDGGPIAPNGVEVPPGYMIVEHSIFCGKDMGITFHVNPQTALKFLPDTAEITNDERIVLKATSGLKNTYGGETDIRYRESRRETGITRERWESAKTTLISQKLLNRAGAITTAGRNAIS